MLGSIGFGGFVGEMGAFFCEVPFLFLGVVGGFGEGHLDDLQTDLQVAVAV